MRIIINGKIYKLRKEVIVKLEGIILILLGLMCYKLDADGAAFFAWCCGAVMLLGRIEK